MDLHKLIPVIPTKSEKIIMDRFYTYMRVKYDPLVKSANEDFKGERLNFELNNINLKKGVDLDKFNHELNWRNSRVNEWIEKQLSEITFQFKHNKRGGLEELAMTIFIELMELKGYRVEKSEGVDTDQQMDYYEPYTAYKILLV